jgi:hypothetical protein
MGALLDPVPNAQAGLENPQSGTRLKGKYATGTDGSKEYQLTTYFHDPTGPMPVIGGVHSVWYDSMLQVDCTFLNAADSQLHCLPGTPAPGDQTTGFIVGFTDAMCTQPIAAVMPAGVGCLPYTVPKYLQIQTNSTNCAYWTQTPVTRVYQPGAPAAQPTALYVITPGPGLGTCSAIPNVPNAMAWYSATEVPPSMFVQGTAGIDP